MNKELESSYTQFKKTKEQFIERIVNSSKEQQFFQASENVWSMMDVLEHIIISETLILGFMKKNPPAESNYKISLKNKIAYNLLQKFFRSSQKVKTPSKTLNPTGEKSMDELLNQSKENNEAFRKILEDFPDDKLKYSVFKHPVSGGMNMQHTVDFCKIHMIHHSHQLDRIEGHVNYPKS